MPQLPLVDCLYWTRAETRRTLPSAGGSVRNIGFADRTRLSRVFMVCDGRPRGTSLTPLGMEGSTSEQRGALQPGPQVNRNLASPSR